MYTNYDWLEKLGKGGYGTVYRGQEKNTQRIVALKRISVKRDDGIPSNAMREISLMKDLHHDNILRCFNVFFAPSSVILVFEYCDFDLRQYMEAYGHRETSALQPSTTHSFMHQLMQALHFCHDHKILHRDIKPENILINRDGVLKLGDFGLARGVRIPVSILSDKVVTLWYRTPDLLLGAQTHNAAIDMWSSGCVFAEMITGEPLFCGRNERDQLYKIMGVVGTPEVETVLHLTPEPKYFQLPVYEKIEFRDILPTASTYALDLLERLLHFEPSKRANAHQVLQHAYFVLPYYVAPRPLLPIVV